MKIAIGFTFIADVKTDLPSDIAAENIFYQLSRSRIIISLDRYYELAAQIANQVGVDPVVKVHIIPEGVKDAVT